MRKEMIAYDLQCPNGHRFEGWFEDETAYLKQKEAGMIACPVCNAIAVSRIPSVFSIKSASASTSVPASQTELAALSGRIVDYIQKNFDDVGCNFAKEALKMHYGVSEARNIRGTSTKEEEDTLRKEGIDFFKIPVQPKPDSDA